MKVLAVGINEYHDLSRLYSCVNDAVDIKNFFLQKVGLPKQDINCLTSFQQTKKDNILINFREFVNSIEPGETGYFFYSAHGGIFKVDTEVCEGVYTSDDAIYEFEFQQIVDLYLSDKAKLVAIIDTCHSGGIIIALISKQLNNGLEIKTPFSQINNWPKYLQKKPKKRFLEPLKENRTTFAACDVEELAYGDVFDGKMNGVFTYYFLQRLKADPKLTFEGMYSQLKSKLPDRTRKHHQTPQLKMSEKFTNSTVIT